MRNREDLIEFTQHSVQKMYREIHEQILYYKEKINHLQNSYALKKPADLMKQYQQRLDELVRNVEIQIQYRIESKKDKIENFQRQLFSLSPSSVLKRGYTLCFTDADDKLLRQVDDVPLGEKVRIQFYRGHSD